MAYNGGNMSFGGMSPHRGPNHGGVQFGDQSANTSFSRPTSLAGTTGNTSQLNTSMGTGNISTLGRASTHDQAGPGSGSLAGVATPEQLAALEEASRRLDTHHTVDKNNSDIYSSLAREATRVSGDYNHADRPAFYVRGQTPLPDALLEQYRHLECKCFMGLFPEINRAWFTMDNKLFLWNYATQSDFYEYDGLDQIITSVALVRPRPGVFLEEVKYLLVLATPVEIIILGVYFANQDVSDEIELIHTQLSVPSDQVNMLKIAGTPSGRIFMAGRDGSLYELTYQSEETWLRSRCTKINHTAGTVYRMVPSFLKWTAEDALVSLEYDPTRHVLYTLSEQGVITVYDLGVKGDSFTRVTNITNLTRKVQDLTRTPNHSPIHVVGISHLPVEEGSSAHLIAFTSEGDRLYFTTSNGPSYLRSVERPKTLRLIYIRQVPNGSAVRPASSANLSQSGFNSLLGGRNNTSHFDGNSSLNGYGAGNTSALSPGANATPEVGCAFYRRGCALLADASAENKDSLISVAPDPVAMFPASPTAPQYGSHSYLSSKFIETATVLDIQGKIWDICEVLYPDVTDELRADESMMYGDSVTGPTGTARGSGTVGGSSGVVSSSSGALAPGQLYANAVSSSSTGGVAPEDLLVLNELVTQHRSEPREFLLLTATGIYRIAKTRPVDVLYQILEQSRGQETQWMHYFVKRFGEDQTCAMALHLLCQPVSLASGRLPALPRTPTQGGLSASAVSPASPAAQQGVSSQAVQQYSKHAFFHFGGTPYFDSQRQGVQDYSAANSAALRGLDVGRAVTAPNLIFSGCHEGVVMLLARVLHPAWNLKITMSRQQGFVAGMARSLTTGGNPDQQLRSPAIWKRVANLLQGVSLFFQDNPAFAAAPSHDSNNGDLNNRNTNHRVLDMQRRQTQTEARRMEQRSLHDLSLLVNRTLEAIAFLDVLSNHDFPQLLASIPADMQDRISNLTFRQLVVSMEGVELSRCLVAALINKSYISKQESVDLICDQLTQRCGAFFGAADLVRYKGYELLEKAKSSNDPLERHRLLEDSLARFCKIAEHVSFESLCAEYQYLHFYTGIIELGLCRAQALDPQNMAIDYQPGNDDPNMLNSHAASGSGVGVSVSHQHGSVDGPSNRDRRHYFDLRIACYQTILNSLQHLFVSHEQIVLPSPDDNAPMSARPRLDPAERERIKHKTLAKAISSTDRLFHLSLYQWHINNGLTDLLLEYQSPFLEEFLRQTYTRAMERVMRGEPTGVPAATTATKSSLNLLWQYYVRNQKFAAAVLILSKLAESRGRIFDLKERIRYLSLAIGNCKSTGSSADVDGDKLHDLKAKMDVAHVQLKLYHELQDKLDRLQMSGGDQSSNDMITTVQNALGELEEELFTISILYNQYATKFQLWESGLAILHCAQHDDRTVIHQIWENLIEQAIRSERLAGPQGVPTHPRTEALATKVVSLARIYYPAAEFVFPVAHIAGLLEALNYSIHNDSRAPTGDLLWVVHVFTQVNVPTATLFSVYDALYQSRQGIWADQDARLHLLSVIALVLRDWIQHVQQPHSSKLDRQQFMSKNVADALAGYVVDLQGAGSRNVKVASLMDDFRQLQGMLQA